MKTQNKRMPILVACSLALCTLPAFAGGDHHKGEDHFKMMDTDGDGRVSRAEHQAAAKKMFTECDANHDGVVTADEMESAKMAKMDDSDDKMEMSAKDKIAMRDQDKDGRLTASEHDAGAEQMFAKMDRDGDGYLSQAECKEGKKLMHKNHDNR